MFRVIVHPPPEEPVAETNGLDIRGASSNNIALKVVKNCSSIQKNQIVLYFNVYYC